MGGKINSISRGLGVSTRTVSNIIEDNSATYRNTFFSYDHRRLPRNRNNFIEVKINGIARALVSWITVFDKYGTFDMDCVLEGNEPP